MERPEQLVKPGAAPATIWWAMFAGPLAWVLDMGFSYMLEQHTCSTGHHYVLHVITVVCALIALSGFVAGFLAHSSIPPEATETGPRPVDRTLFQLVFGIAFSLAFFVVIVADAVPRFILNPCQ